ncbi:unnamed protein product [Amaranthus hypochondriacus]
MDILSMNKNEQAQQHMWVPPTPEKISTTTSITADLEYQGLSFLQILGIDNGIREVEANQGQPQSKANEPQLCLEPIHEIIGLGDATNTIGVDKDQSQESNEKNGELPMSQPKNKKRKINSDINKQSGVKRKNKYYWPKIDVPNVRTPKLKTPKTKTKKSKVEENRGKECSDDVSKTKENYSCKRVLDMTNNSITSEVEKVREKEIIQLKEQSLVPKPMRVYRKSPHKFKCVTECRQAVPNFFCRKKRSIRKKRSNINMLNAFNCMLQNTVDRTNLAEGDLKTLIPSKGKILWECFGCVFTLLNSRKNLTKKKRSNRNRIKIKVVKEKTEAVEEKKEVVKEKTEIVQEKTEIVQVKAEAVKEKTKVVKEKMLKRRYKRRDNNKDYLRTLEGWDDKSLSNIMDQFVKPFASLQLYDDASKFEPWDIMCSSEEGTLNIEKFILCTKARRFLQTMKIFQGPKKFVEWKGSVLDSVVGVFLTQNVCDVLSSTAYMELASRYPVEPIINQDCEKKVVSEGPIIELPNEDEDGHKTFVKEIETESSTQEAQEYKDALKVMLESLPSFKNNGKDKKGNGSENDVDWEAIRLHFAGNTNAERNHDQQDSVDWAAVRNANVKDIAEAIQCRGQHFIIASKIQKTLNRLVGQHGTMDLEWLRKAPHQVGKAYLLSFYGLGLKSVECLRLLTLKDHGGFPVDVNIARIAVRLGWIPLQPLPNGLPFHVLQKYPLENKIQQYLLPRLDDLTQDERYELHYQMITFGKVFCTKRNPNCNACPFKAECKYFKSREDSLTQKHRFLSWTSNGKIVVSKGMSKKNKNIINPFAIKRTPSLLSEPSTSNSSVVAWSLPTLDCYPSSLIQGTNKINAQNYIVEHPTSPIREEQDIEDLCKNLKDDVCNIDPNEEQDIEEFLQSSDRDGKRYDCDIDLTLKCKDDVCNKLEQSSEEQHSSRALVSLNAEHPSPPVQIKHLRLRTEHQVYELPSDHPLLKDFDRQDGDVPYLLAIWPQANEECLNQDEINCTCTTVPGTILIPVRTAMRGRFPLNGTYFQINEVFADDETSQQPVNVPTNLIWNLVKRTLYCGSTTSSIYRGFNDKEIMYCNWGGM